MATEAAGGMDLGHAVILLAAGVVAVPIFRRLGLGAVLGYLKRVLQLPHEEQTADDDTGSRVDHIALHCHSPAD